MKRWRKQAEKRYDEELGMVVRNGRMLKRDARMQEMMMAGSPKTYPLLEAMFKCAGVTYNLSKAQQVTLQRMIEESNANATEEIADEAE